jgi:hypothetical protein
MTLESHICTLHAYNVVDEPCSSCNGSLALQITAAAPLPLPTYAAVTGLLVKYKMQDVRRMDEGLMNGYYVV